MTVADAVPMLSVVLASCRDQALVRAALDGLRPQCAALGAELVVARPVQVIASDPTGLLDGCRVVACPPDATVPVLRGAGLAAAHGAWAALTEDNCLPASDWLSRLASGMTGDVAVVGGSMGNARPARAIDAGAFFAEYGFFGPRRHAGQPGAAPLITGANVAYRRGVLSDVAAWASAGAWEDVVHGRLAAQGVRFRVVPDAMVLQNLEYTLGGFCRDRFDHGHDYAVVRTAEVGWLRRLALAAGTAALPPLLGWRVWRSAGRATPGAFLRALPFTLIFLGAWAMGEAAGYLRAGQRSR